MQNTNQKEYITPNKSVFNNQRFDSETYESSKKDCDLSQIDNFTNDKIQKKSIDFFPKKINIDELELDNSFDIHRKYTIETQLMIKDFVPQLRPIKTHIVPPKLSLNKRVFNDYLKYNKNNKILLHSKKYSISCPNSDEEDTDKYNSSKEVIFFENKNNEKIYKECKEFVLEDNKNINIYELRKNLQNMKNKKIPKIHSKNDISIKEKYCKDLNLDNSSDSDLYDFDEIDNYTLLELDKKDEKDNEINVKKSRTHSFTILEMLQKRVEKDEE